MKPLNAKAVFKDEAALCKAFISQIPRNWTAYAETAGFDILLVRSEDGAQIGIEAKMSLNAKVILQAAPEPEYSRMRNEAPDFRACLVPYGTAGAEMKTIAYKLGIRVIEMKTRELFTSMREKKYYGDTRIFIDKQVKAFEPELPRADGTVDYLKDWIDLCPSHRCRLPAYVPDVAAGRPAPQQLSEWKIKAIKICIVLERRGWLCIADFIHVDIDRRRFMVMGWIQPMGGVYKDRADGRGKYVAGSAPLDLRRQHPVNYAQIEADFSKWKPKDPEGPLVEGVLL